MLEEVLLTSLGGSSLFRFSAESGLAQDLTPAITDSSIVANMFQSFLLATAMLVILVGFYLRRNYHRKGATGEHKRLLLKDVLILGPKVRLMLIETPLGEQLLAVSDQRVDLIAQGGADSIIEMEDKTCQP